MAAIDILSLETIYAQRLRTSIEHIELIASSIDSAIAGGSDDVYALIPSDDLTLARAIVGLAQSNSEYESMFEGEVTSR